MNRKAINLNIEKCDVEHCIYRVDYMLSDDPDPIIGYCTTDSREIRQSDMGEDGFPKFCK